MITGHFVPLLKASSVEQTYLSSTTPAELSSEYPTIRANQTFQGPTAARQKNYAKEESTLPNNNYC